MSLFRGRRFGADGLILLPRVGHSLLLEVHFSVLRADIEHHECPDQDEDRGNNLARSCNRTQASAMKIRGRQPVEEAAIHLSLSRVTGVAHLPRHSNLMLQSSVSGSEWLDYRRVRIAEMT